MQELMRLCPYCNTRHGPRSQKCQKKRQVESARKLLRSKRPRIDNDGAFPLVEFIGQNSKTRDWVPAAHIDELEELRRKDAAKNRPAPKGRPVVGVPKS
jgi:hypothetical protein